MEDKIIFTVECEDGSEKEMELVCTFFGQNEREYAAIISADDEDVNEVELVRFYKGNNNDINEFKIEGIFSDIEFKIAKKAFEKYQQEYENPGELPVLTFDDENGKSKDWQVVDVFGYNSRKYIALIPMDGDTDRVEINLMRVTLMNQDDLEGCKVESIPSDMEFDEVSKAFEERVNLENSNSLSE